MISNNLKPKRIVSLSLSYPDAATALSIDVERSPALQEERFTRKRHDPNFLHTALKYCLQSTKLTLNGIAHIIRYKKPLLPHKKLTETYLGAGPRGRRPFFAVIQVWQKEKLFFKSEIKNQLRNIQKKLQEIAEDSFNLAELLFSDLHLTHATLTLKPSPIREAVTICMD